MDHVIRSCDLMVTGKKLLGRSHVKHVAQKRLVGINEYCKVMMMSLVDLSHHRWSPQNWSPGPSMANFVAIVDPPGLTMAAMDGPPGQSTAP